MIRNSFSLLFFQKVKNCSGPIEELNELNHEGRKKISLLRNNLALLRTLSEEEAPNVQLWLLEEVQKSEEELRATIAAFQKANITALTAIDKANRSALLGNDADGVVRHRYGGCIITLSCRREIIIAA